MLMNPDWLQDYSLKPMTSPTQLLFLPGASGDTEFWHPVAQRLRYPIDHVHLGWPGFGTTPANFCVQGIQDLANLALSHIKQPTAVIAQSMGGAIALLAALDRPELITHLVLAATSGGVDMSSLTAHDWRPDFLAANPTLPRWFIDTRLDLTARLPSIEIPVLLLWGDADPISPIAVGVRLAHSLPNANLHVLTGGRHDVARSHADQVAGLIAKHLWE